MMPRRIRTVGRFLVVACTVVLGMTGVVSVASAASINYAALGDSYSAGVGAGDYGDSGSCKRSANSYPKLWQAQHDVADFQFPACLGARTADVVNGQSGVLSTRTTLVTITIGGNDAGFTDVMVDCTVNSDQGCVDRIAEAKKFVDNELPARLDNVYASIKQKAPNARLVVLGYPHFYQLNGSCNIGLSETKRRAINSGADELAIVTAKRAADAGVTFVDMREPFSGHEICSSDRWLNSVVWPVDESYHPNKAGQARGYLPALTKVTD